METNNNDDLTKLIKNCFKSYNYDCLKNILIKNVDSIHNLIIVENIINNEKKIVSLKIYCFQHSCLSGYLDIVIWMLQNLKFTREEITMDYNYTLKYSARNGHLNICQLLHSFCNFKKIETIATFEFSCYNNQLKICNWLHNTFHYEKELILKYLDQFGLLFIEKELFIWMLTKFKITTEDLRNNNNNILYSACYHDKFEIVYVLFYVGGLTKSDAECVLRKIPSINCQNKLIEISEIFGSFTKPVKNT
jgi:hypothetical protein